MKRTHTVTCGWPGCVVAISWQHAFCYRLWKRVPPAERNERTAEVWRTRRQRSPDYVGSVRVPSRVALTDSTGDTTDRYATRGDTRTSATYVPRPVALHLPAHLDVPLRPARARLPPAPLPAPAASPPAVCHDVGTTSRYQDDGPVHMTTSQVEDNEPRLRTYETCEREHPQSPTSPSRRTASPSR